MKTIFKFMFPLLIVLSVLLPLCSSLECNYCRTNKCSHQYCNEANSLMEKLGLVLNAEAWGKIPNCPETDDSSKTRNNSDYISKCPKKATACGRSIFNITTTSSKQIVPGENATVPVLGSGATTQNSAVIVYGCVLPKYKSCSPGQSKEFKVPGPPESTPNSTEGTITDIVVANTESACCYCQRDLCNRIEGSLTCDANTAQSDTPVAAAATGLPGGSATVILVTLLLFST